MKVISVIEDQDIIKKILKHLGLWEVNPPEVLRVKPRPPPRMAMIQPLYAEPHIDYSARPGATRLQIVACVKRGTLVQKVLDGRD